MLLRSPPYKDPNLLVYVSEFWPHELPVRGVPSPDFQNWREHADIFEDLAGYGGGAEVFSSGLNDFLRRKAGLEPRLVELSILAAVREMDGEYEWTAHEPAALKAGVSPEIVDVIKYRKPLTGIGEKDATIIELGRESVGKHKVSSETFDRALKLFGDRQLINIVCLMGDYSSTAILLNTFDQHVRPTDKPLLPIP